MTQEVMKQALEALTCTGEDDDPGHRCGHCDDYVDRNGLVRAALRAALEQPVQEPVAWGMPDALWNIVETISPDEKITDMKAWADQYSVPLYTTPPQRKPLTIKEVNAMPEAQGGWPMGMNDRIVRLIRAVEAAHGIKETP